MYNEYDDDEDVVYDAIAELDCDRTTGNDENVKPMMSTFSFHPYMPLDLRFECMKWPVISMKGPSSYYDIVNKTKHCMHYTSDYMRVSNHDWEEMFKDYRSKNVKAKIIVKNGKQEKSADGPRIKTDPNTGRLERNDTKDTRLSSWTVGIYDSKERMWVPHKTFTRVKCDKQANKKLFDEYTPEQLANEFDKLFYLYDLVLAERGEKSKKDFKYIENFRNVLITCTNRPYFKFEKYSIDGFDFIFKGDGTGTMDRKARQAVYLSENIAEILKRDNKTL
jgi:hypothetical protein